MMRFQLHRAGVRLRSHQSRRLTASACARTVQKAKTCSDGGECGRQRMLLLLVRMLQQVCDGSSAPVADGATNHADAAPIL